MNPSARIASVIEIFELLHHTWQTKRHAPVDRLMASYYKSRRYMGSKDRAFVSEMAYGILRHGGALEWHIMQLGYSITPRSITIAALVFFYNQDEKAISPLFNGSDKYGPGELTQKDSKLIHMLNERDFENETMPVTARHNFPDWMHQPLLDVFGDDFDAELTALNKEAPIDLRVNTLTCPSRSDLIFALDQAGYTAMPTPHSPLGVRLTKRIAAFGTQAFKDGWFEMQDEGSQIAALLIEAKAGQKVIDFCAGAGGKTLAIAASMQNKGRILALDVHEGRLKELKKRLKRAKIDNVTTKAIAHETDKQLKRHHQTADWVLVDAPCSGSGTWRRNPDLKWRMTPDDIDELQLLQRRILAAASKLVKPGGKMVYVTCSLFADENEAQLTQFLMDYPEFRLVRPAKLWDSLCKELPDDAKSTVIRLSPYQHQTDGFFAAIMQREAISTKKPNNNNE
jgi:16S rRNA (cytosine967-C5)-methyltransferase